MCLYEARPSYGPSSFHIVFMILFILFCFYIVKTWRKSTISVRAFLAVVAMVMVLIIVSTAWTAIHSFQHVYIKYTRGEYATVEGIISDYEAITDGSQMPDSFMVKGINFIAPGFTTIWGYPLRRADGGVLKDGMKVKIHYIHYKFENVIMRLEVMDE